VKSVRLLLMSRHTLLTVFYKYTAHCIQQIPLKSYYLSTRLHGVIYSTTKLSVHRATTMFRVTVWVPLLCLVLILKQSDAVSDKISDLEIENIDLETYLKRIRELKQQNKTSCECKVSVCECECV
jgi:hypothetical protein